MIVKKIKNPDKTSTKAQRIKGLVGYILNPEADGGEKCTHWGAFGFITDTQNGIISEMIALSEDAERSKDTVNHYILSWQEGEQPSYTQVDYAVSMFIDEIGLSEHQVVYALHGDTHNHHVHIAVNRVHPDSLRCAEINRGFDIEAAHKAVAKIEHVQGWERQIRGRYIVLETGDLARAHIDVSATKKASQDRRDMELRTGERSAESIAIEIAGPIIKKASSWDELHTQLASEGIRYEKKGSGAVVFVGDTGVKASKVSREASLGKIQQRLGPFHAAVSVSPAAEKKRKPEPVVPRVPGWAEYQSLRESYYIRRTQAKAALDADLEKEKSALYVKQRERREHLFAEKSWKGRGEALNALRSFLAAQQHADAQEMQARHRKKREEYRQQWRPLPDFEAWLRAKDAGLADEYRYLSAPTRSPAQICGEGAEELGIHPKDIRSYRGEVVDCAVHYERAGGGDGADFIDRGKSIDVLRWEDEGATLAALQLAMQKWDKITLTGSPEYKAMCVRLAVKNGIEIVNPELQDMIKAEREKLEKGRVSLPQVEDFRRYHSAVKADRYRVTVIKMHEDGTQQAFLLDKFGGESRGFLPEQVIEKMPEMLKLQRRGENLYYTPLSTGRHHILIDDMTDDTLNMLVEDGYNPATVIQSSPGNYQAIITIPKLGSQYDRDVGNRLAEQLNQRYGDIKLSGCIHPHRAPGFENRKPKHMRDDGSYPRVEIVRTDAAECPKTLSMACEINDGYKERAEKEKKKIKKSPQVTGSLGSAADAYYRHCEDILSRQHGSIDMSRLDAMIAIRLRVTGHDRSSIQSAIQSCAPTIRDQPESRNWADYAERTARYAFGPGGEQQAEKLKKYTRLWLKIEDVEHGNEKLKPKI